MICVAPISRKGFSLIELMAAMLILSIAVLVVATIFNDATKAWDIGTRRVDSNNAGRAVVDMLAREMSAALADDTLRFKVLTNSGLTPYDGERSDQIALVSLVGKPARGERAAQEILYSLAPAEYSNGDPVTNRFALMRATREAGPSYSSPSTDWWKNTSGFKPQVVVENIAAFEIRAFHLEQDENRPINNFSSESALKDGHQAGLPTFIEIYLEVLDDKDAATAQMMFDNKVPDRREFVERRARRYFARVYPDNREGYRVMAP